MSSEDHTLATNFETIMSVIRRWMYKFSRAKSTAVSPISDVQKTQKIDKLIEEITSNHVLDELMISTFYS